MKKPTANQIKKLRQLSKFERELDAAIRSLNDQVSASADRKYELNYSLEPINRNIKDREDRLQRLNSQFPGEVVHVDSILDELKDERAIIVDQMSYLTNEIAELKVPLDEAILFYQPISTLINSICEYLHTTRHALGIVKF